MEEGRPGGPGDLKTARGVPLALLRLLVLLAFLLGSQKRSHQRRECGGGAWGWQSSPPFKILPPKKQEFPFEGSSKIFFRKQFDFKLRFNELVPGSDRGPSEAAHDLSLLFFFCLATTENTTDFRHSQNSLTFDKQLPNLSFLDFPDLSEESYIHSETHFSRPTI